MGKDGGRLLCIYPFHTKQKTVYKVNEFFPNLVAYGDTVYLPVSLLNTEDTTESEKGK